MESRWKVAGVAMVVAAVLAAGAAAQHQLSHTSLAVSLPLGDLAAAASSGQHNTFSEVPHAADSVDGLLQQHHREASPKDTSNELFHITPVKLTQANTAEVLDGASENPGTLTSEAGEPFFIVVNDLTADTANSSPPASHEGPQDNTHILDERVETPHSAVAEVQDTTIIPGEEDPRSTQHSLNTVDDTDQNISSPDDNAEILDSSVVSGERGAKAIDAAAPADAEVFPQPLAEDSVLKFEQSFDIISGEVFTESTPASTLSIEAQFQDLSQRVDEALPTETPVTVSFSDITMDDALPTDPSATDPQTSPEISLEEQTPDAVPAKISAGEQTPEPVPPDVLVQEPSPAPIPVRISLDEPASDTILGKLSVKETTPSQIPHEVLGATTHEDGRESHDLKAPQTQVETGIGEVELPGFENIEESPESHNPTQPPSDIQNMGNAPTEATQEDSVSHSVTGNVARLVEVTPTVRLPAPGNEEELAAQPNETAAAAAADAAGSTSEPQLEVGRVNNDEVLFVQDLPQGTGGASGDTGDPFAPQIESFNPDPPIDVEALAVVPEWIAEDSVSGETFNHSDVIEVPSLPMDDIEVFFLAEDPQADDGLATEVQGVGVTEVKQQLQKDEVHIAALPDAVPFSPGEVQITPQVHEAVKDALQAEIAAMGAFGMKVPDEAAAAATPPAPAPTTLPVPTPAPAHLSGAAPAPSPPQTFEIDTTFVPASEPLFKPAPVHAPTPVKAPVQEPPQKPIIRPTPGQVHHPVQESTLNEPPKQSLRPAPAKIQSPAAPSPAPAYASVPAPAPVPEVTEAPAHISSAPATIQRPPSTSQTYRPRPKPTRPRPKPTHPRPKPARPTYKPQLEPTHPPYQPRPRPTRPPYRPTKPPTPSTYPPPTASPPLAYKPGRLPISYVNVEEPKPEHFKPPSYQGPIPHLPTSYDDFSSPPRHPLRPSSPPPLPAPPPPSYKPPSSTSYRPQPSTSYKPPSSTSYSQRRPPFFKPRPSITRPPAVPSSSQYKPPPRPKPPAITPKPQYRPAPATHKPHKTPKPILAPVLVPAHLSSIVFPKGVTFSGHHKPRLPPLFHFPSFFRKERKQRLQVPESVMSRLDSDQPDWVADLEPERR